MYTRITALVAAAAAAAVIAMLAAACGSGDTTSGNPAPSATARHSASSPAQPPKASTAMCQDNAALQASLASLAQVSTGKGALKQVKADVQDARAKLSTLIGDAHDTFSTQIIALKSALTTLQTTVQGVRSGSSSVADVRTAFDGVTTATGDLSTALSQGGCSSVG
jgi:uncharacterized protein YukE